MSSPDEGAVSEEAGEESSDEEEEEDGVQGRGDKQEEGEESDDMSGKYCSSPCCLVHKGTFRIKGQKYH